MADNKYTLPKVAVAGRRRRGRRATSSMAPASVAAPGLCLEGEADEEREGGHQQQWCKQCLRRGARSTLRHLQINEELAVFVCDGDQCTALPTLAPGCQLVVERRAADIIHCRRRKRRATSLPSNMNLQQKAHLPSTTDSDKLVSQSQTAQQSHDPSVTMASPLPARSVVQWSNENHMCWLDVSMLLLVQFCSLRRCLQSLGATSLLQQLCREFDAAQCTAGLTDQVSKLLGQMKSTLNNNCEVNSLTDHQVSDIDLLSSFLRNDSQLGKSNQDYTHSIDNGLLSDKFLSFLDGNMQSNNSCFKNPGLGNGLNATLLGENSPELQLNQTSLEDGINSINLACDGTTSKIAAAMCALRKKRKELFEKLQAKLGCVEGKDGSPVAALQTLLRLDGVVEEHFMTRYRREFYCFSCSFTYVTVHKNVVLSLASTSKDFSMQHPTMHHPCPQCKAPGQISRIVYHSMPVCPLVHLTAGLSAPPTDDPSWTHRDFRHHGHFYQLTCIVQYKHNPDHFVIWIRDPSREQWLQCDDLSSPVCLWQSQEPSIPPSEVHILGWERQSRDCGACAAFKQLVTEIQEAPLLQREDGAAAGRTHQTGPRDSSSCLAPLRKKSCPVMVGGRSSPMTTRSSHHNVTPAKDAPRTTGANNQSLPSVDPANVLMIGTPPQSPEFQLPQKESLLESVTNPQSASCAISPEKELARGSCDHRGKIEELLSKGAPGRIAAISHQSTGPRRNSRERNKMSVGSYLQSKRKSTVPTPAEQAGLLGTFAIHMREQSSVDGTPDETEPRSSRSSNGFSLLRTLRSLNTKLNLPDHVERKSTSKGNRKNVDAKSLKEGLKLASSVRKLHKVRLPRHKFDSFSAFKDKKTTTYSGYMKQKDPPLADKEDSPKESHVKKDPKDDYQSSVLLTPSSSVSSPSACSVSLQNDVEVAGPLDVNDSQNLTNTMDALCKALEISSDARQEATVPQPDTYLDDNNFLENLLR